MGRCKIFKDPLEIWEHYLDYKIDIKLNPLKEKKWVGKDAKAVEVLHFEPPTWKGFDAYLFGEGVIARLEEYKANYKGNYDAFSDIIRAIDNDMFRIKFSGAATGFYNQNIIAREIKLGEVQEINHDVRPILEGGLKLPEGKT